MDLGPFYKKCWDIICCRKCRTRNASDEGGNASATDEGIQTHVSDVEGDTNRPSNFFLNMTRAEVLKWHIGGIKSLLCNADPDDIKDYELIHHRNCYGYLRIHGKGQLRKVSAIDGIRMAEYMKIYERKNLTKITFHDRAKLTQLTKNTLFCKSCYMPVDETHYRDELTSPFVALVDIISACFFPLGLIPLLLFLPFLIVYGLVVNCKRDQDNGQGESG